MGERLAHPNRISDRAFSTKGRRVWVIMVIAPLLWLGLWLTVEMLYKDSISGRVQSQQMAEQMRPWMRVAADIGLMIWVCFWLRRAGLKVRDIGLKAEWLAREVIIGALVGLALWVSTLGPLWILGLRNPQPASSLLLTFQAPARFLQLGVVAFSEEVVWRGYTLTEMHRLYRLSASVVIASIGFSIFYLGEAVVFDWFVFPLMLFIGGWLNLLYLWRRSLIAVIVARFVFGGLGFS